MSDERDASCRGGGSARRGDEAFGGDSPRPGLRAVGSVDRTPRLQRSSSASTRCSSNSTSCGGALPSLPRRSAATDQPPPVDRRTAPLGEGLAELAKLVRKLRIMAASSSVARGGGRDAQPSPPAHATPASEMSWHSWTTWCGRSASAPA
jgi:hypothetical protein